MSFTTIYLFIGVGLENFFVNYYIKCDILDTNRCFFLLKETDCSSIIMQQQYNRELH